MTPLAPVLAVFGLGTPEILIILFIVLLLFGAKKLPELARGLGKSVSEFKKATNDAEKEIKTAMDESSKPADAAKPADKKPEAANSSAGPN